MQYTALISRNFRDINHTVPKVLLRDIRDAEGNLFRDHAWVDLIQTFNSVLPEAGDNNSYRIQFTARPKEYCTIGPIKTTLTRFRNIIRVCEGLL